MSFKIITPFICIMLTSTAVCAQQSYSRSISINGGLTFGVANRIMQRPSSFTTKGEMMGSVSVSYLFITKRSFRLGVASDLFDINYQIYSKFKAEDGPGQITMSYHALAASNFVLSAGLLGTFNLYKSNWYDLNLNLSPRIGYLIYNSFYDNPENLNGGRTQYHPEFWEWNTVRQSKFIFPLLKAGIENEVHIFIYKACYMPVNKFGRITHRFRRHGFYTQLIYFL